jgi:hypothetical protein
VRWTEQQKEEQCHRQRARDEERPTAPGAETGTIRDVPNNRIGQCVDAKREEDYKSGGRRRESLAIGVEIKQMKAKQRAAEVESELSLRVQKQGSKPTLSLEFDDSTRLERA